MNPCKNMQTQNKSMKATQLYPCGRQVDVKFIVFQNQSDDIEDLETLVASIVTKKIEISKNSKAKAIYDSNLENELDQFYFQKLDITSESESEQEHVHEESPDKAKLCIN